MGLYAIKLPDVGEGVAEAELIEWTVAVGDVVKEDDVLAVVMTDKANIEIPSSVSGTIVWLGGEVGDTLAVGADLIRLEVAGDGNSPAVATERLETSTPATASATDHVTPQPTARVSAPAAQPSAGLGELRPGRSSPKSSSRQDGEKPLAAPSIRKRAREAGIDLRHVSGFGPAGRITHDDLDGFLEQGPRAARGAGRARDTSVERIKVVGLRRKIAEKMALSKAKIPHITIIEEIDVTNLEDLRAELNTTYADVRPKLTLLPFMVKAIVEAVREQPQMNAHFNDDDGIISQFGGIHVGIATQTANGLTVPVARHVEVMSLWDSAAEIARLAAAAREGTLTRDELMGSTITITSLGPLGAIATTPIINHPEVAIVGINKMSIRPWWDGQQFAPRKMMNISCSFDHRVIDGWDAAVFVQKLKTLLETPAMLFVES